MTPRPLPPVSITAAPRRPPPCPCALAQPQALASSVSPGARLALRLFFRIKFIHSTLLIKQTPPRAQRRDPRLQAPAPHRHAGACSPPPPPVPVTLAPCVRPRPPSLRQGSAYTGILVQKWMHIIVRALWVDWAPCMVALGNLGYAQRVWSRAQSLKRSRAVSGVR